MPRRHSCSSIAEQLRMKDLLIVTTQKLPRTRIKPALQANKSATVPHHHYIAYNSSKVHIPSLVNFSASPKVLE